MPMTLASKVLGVGAWATLQAAYPNGGALLSAMAGDALYLVTDIGKKACWVTPNAGKTRWVPVNGRHTLAHACGTEASPLAVWSGTTGKYSWPGGDITIPAGVLSAGDSIVASFKFQKRGTNATASAGWRIGTTGSYGTDTRPAYTTITNSNKRLWWCFMSAGIGASSTVMSSSDCFPNNQTTAGSLDLSTNFDVTSQMYVILEVTSLNASDFIDLLEADFTWVAA